MNHGSLFSGIGGFDLAAEWMGWNNVFHCEIAEFPRKILNYYWPNAKSYTDVKTADFSIHRGTIDILTGGFPCQPYSAAGKRKGKDDDRHLWPYMLEAIRTICPRWIVGENVFGLLTWNDGLVFHEVQSDLEAEGYEVFPYVLPAVSVNAPHRRDRVWFVAYANSKRREEYNVPEKSGSSKLYCGGDYAQRTDTDADDILRQRRNNGGEDRRCEQVIRAQSFGQPNQWKEFPTQSPVCGGNDGLPTELDGITFSKWRKESVKGYGNAIVPQVVLQIFKAIEMYERNHQLLDKM